jgi:two-component system chemotaxis sensor kinase CheA
LARGFISTPLYRGPEHHADPSGPWQCCCVADFFAQFSPNKTESVSPSESAEPNPALPAYLDDFFAECDEHLTSARQSLLALEPVSHQPEVDRTMLEELFRDFHSIKGLAAMVGLKPAEQLAHQMESYLGALRQGRVPFSSPGFAALADGVRSLEQVIGAHRAQAAPVDLGSVGASLDALLPLVGTVDDKAGSSAIGSSAGGSIVAAADELNAEQQARVTSAIEHGETAWWVTFMPSAELAERDINVNTVRKNLKSLGELIFSAPQVLAGGQIAFRFLLTTAAEETAFAGWQRDGLSYAPYAAPAPSVPTPAASAVSRAAVSASAAKTVAPTNVVRVGLGRLDELMRMVGDLVITRAKFEENLKQLEAQLPATQWRTLQENNGAFERQIRDLREGIMRTRLVPIREAFMRMQFVLRDFTSDPQSRVRLQLSGEETEVDKLIVERIMDPLLHLVRNAVSHGIEPTAERVAAGKPPAGLIALRARTNGQTVLIEVEDDGRGIDAQQILARAEKLGLIEAADRAETTNILSILCEPGFSTRETVDRTSGRGVGMDVVKNAIEELGGSLSLWTEVGRGTRFTVQLPLTLSIADALVFEVGDQTFALPQSFVQEVFQFEATAVALLESNEIVYRRGVALPLLRLASLFGLASRPSATSYALIVGDAQDAIGLVVDRLLGLREIVIHPLDDPLVRVQGIAGATELGNGRIVLILDALSAVRGLGNRLSGPTSKAAESARGRLQAATSGVSHRHE